MKANYSWIWNYADVQTLRENSVGKGKESKSVNVATLREISA